MGGSVNRVCLLGRLGKEIDQRQTTNGTNVSSTNLATSERYTDKSGKKQEKTEWHSLVFWNKQSEIAAKYLKKGDQIYLEGKLQTRNWDDTNGNKRYMTEIIVHTFVMLGSPKGHGQQQNHGTSQNYSPPPPPSVNNSGAQNSNPSNDDGLPF